MGGLSQLGGGVDTALWLDPPPQKKTGSIAGPPKILLRLTPGPGSPLSGDAALKALVAALKLVSGTNLSRPQQQNLPLSLA